MIKSEILRLKSVNIETGNNTPSVRSSLRSSKVNSWLVQNISNLFSNAFALFVLTTEAGKLFHMFTILTEKGYSVKS